jgi:hypothetical protein
MTLSFRRPALALLAPALFLASPALAQGSCRPIPGGPQGDACAAELVLTEIRQRQMTERLAAVRTAPRPEQCRVFHDHVRTMADAACVFHRCTTGHHRRENVAQMQGSIADWREIIARNCR